MNQTLVYPARVGTRVRSAGGKYEVGVACFKVGDRIIAPGGREGEVSSVHKKIGITWKNGLSAEYTPKQMQAWNYQKFLEDEKTQEAIVKEPMTSETVSPQSLELLTSTNQNSPQSKTFPKGRR